MNRKENQIKFAHQKKYLGKNCAKRALFIAAAVAAFVTHCLDFVIFENMHASHCCMSEQLEFYLVASERGTHRAEQMETFIFHSNAVTDQ